MNQYFNVRYSRGALTATPAFPIHGLCNPITCNVGLHTGATMDKGSSSLFIAYRDEVPAMYKT